MLRSRGHMPIVWHDETNERTVYLTCEFDYQSGQRGIFANEPEQSVEPISPSARIRYFVCDKIVQHGEHGDHEYEPTCSCHDADAAIVAYRLDHSEEDVERMCAGYWCERLEEAMCQGT